MYGDLVEDADELWTYAKAVEAAYPSLTSDQVAGFAALRYLSHRRSVRFDETSAGTAVLLFVLHEDGFVELTGVTWSLSDLGREIAQSEDLELALRRLNGHRPNEFIGAATLVCAMAALLICLRLVPWRGARGFFEASAQVIPVVLLALAVDTRLLKIPKVRIMHSGLIVSRRFTRSYGLFVRTAQVYRGLIAAILVTAEIIALSALVDSGRTFGGAAFVFGAIASGLVALTLDALWVRRR